MLLVRLYLLKVLQDKILGLDRGKMRTIVENTYEVSQSFILDEDEVIYGLGQQQTGKMNQRNQRLVLEQNNMQIAVPLFPRVCQRLWSLLG